MKKLLLTSLFAVGAMSAANAANVINDNPMYRPGEGNFYSVTSLETDTVFRGWGLGEELGYGITDQLSVYLLTSGSAYFAEVGDNEYAWSSLGLGASLRYLDHGNLKADAYGQGVMVGVLDTFEANDYAWNWTVGTKVGWVESDWTVAGLVEANYLRGKEVAGKLEMFERLGALRLGMLGQYIFDSNWNITGSLIYTANAYVAASIDFDGKEVFSGSEWFPEGGNALDLKVGVNYNIDSNMYVGVYATRELIMDVDEKEFGLGAKFGIQF